MPYGKTLVDTIESSGNLAITGNVTTSGTITSSAGTTYPLVSETSQTTTSGTNIDFTNIPSWVKRITVMFNGVSTSGTSEVLLQLGTSSGFTTSGYLGSVSTTRDAVSPGVDLYGTGFLIRYGTTVGTAAAVRHGVATFVNISGNTWVEQHTLGLSSAASNSIGAGLIALAATLTQVRITTVNGTDTFDAGSVNILYE